MINLAERNKRILEMKQQGYTLLAIGAQFGLSKERIRRIVLKEDEKGQGQARLGNLQDQIKEQGEKIQRVKNEYDARRKDLDNWYQKEMDAILSRGEYSNIPIESLGMDTTSNKIMRREGVETIGDILDMLRFNADIIPTWRNFGDYRIAELKKKLKEAGFAIPAPESKD